MLHWTVLCCVLVAVRGHRLPCKTQGSNLLIRLSSPCLYTLGQLPSPQICLLIEGWELGQTVTLWCPQAGSELTLFQPQPPKYWNYRFAPRSLALDLLVCTFRTWLEATVLHMASGWCASRGVRWSFTHAQRPLPPAAVAAARDGKRSKKCFSSEGTTEASTWHLITTKYLLECLLCPGEENVPGRFSIGS